MSPEVAPRQFRVFGMRRSGNHAVIDWLRRNIPGETVFLNDCAPGDPFRTYAMMETPRGDRHGPSFRRTRWFAQFDEGRAGRSHVVSYEDTTPGAVGPPAGWEAPFRTVIVRRSFLNWLASYYALVTDRMGGTAWGVEDWREIRPHVGTYAALLSAPRDLEIDFDRWCADAGYRAEALSALGLPEIDGSTGRPSPYGGGSSFGESAPSPAALGQRWRRLEGRPGYDALVAEAAAHPALMAGLSRAEPETAQRLARRLAA